MIRRTGWRIVSAWALGSLLACATGEAVDESGPGTGASAGEDAATGNGGKSGKGGDAGASNGGGAGQSDRKA